MSDGQTIPVEELRESFREVLGSDPLFGGAVPLEPGRAFDASLYRLMAELGWLALAVPETHGGLGLGFAHACALDEVAGAVLATTPHAGAMEVAGLLAICGTPEQQARLLPGLLDGSTIAALVDPVKGLDAQGRAQLVPFGGEASLLAVPVSGGIALLERQACMVQQRPAFDLTRPTADVTLPPAALAGAETIPLTSEAFADHRSRCAVRIAADAIGGASAILEITLEYLKLRRQFGRAIGSFQALKHRAAEWKSKLEAATSLVRHAAQAIDSAAVDRHSLASSAKYYACDQYAGIAEDCVQMHGGIGFTWDHVAHLYLKRAKLDQQLAGTSRWHRDQVARSFGDVRPDAKKLQFRTD